MQTLKEKTAEVCTTLRALADSSQAYPRTGRNNELSKSSLTRAVWNKGWGKYGKT